MGFFGHWSLFYHEPNKYVHLNLWELLHMKQELALFFKRLEVNLVEAWDDEGNAIIHSLPWKKPSIPQQREYIVHILHNIECLLVPQGSMKRPQGNS